MGDSMPSTASTSNETKRPATLRAEDLKHIPLTEDKNNVTSPRFSTANNPYSRRESLDLDDYFTGPRDMSRHSKWPMFMRLHGSIMPKMVLPLIFVGCWSSLIVTLSMKLDSVNLAVDSVLLTVLGFVISLGLSFRNSTAYERYAEGRRYWSMLVTSSQTLGRVFWIHATDVEDQDPKDLMLKKLSAMNMVVAFSVALKHSLRFEPYTEYNDIQHLIGHLNTFARDATDAKNRANPNKSLFKETGEYLGISFAASNPRKTLKKSQQPLGNLPLEILNYIAVTVDEMIRNKQLEIPMLQTLSYNHIGFLNDILSGCDRVLNTPLPLAYAIAISQITWVYVLLLPFQLITPLKWIAIPASVFAAYVILGLLLIGGEIENPFGQDVNDLPLENYCEQIAHDMDVIASFEKRNPDGFMKDAKNLPLYPTSMASYDTWMQRSEDELRNAIRKKPKKTFDMKKTRDENNPLLSGDNMV
jgi:predicted membrane chloride channel (bestrophin family)